MIKKGTIIKTVVNDPVKVILLARVDDISNSFTLSLSNMVASIDNADYLSLAQLGEEHIDDCKPIESNEFDIIYDIKGKKLFK